MDSLHTPPPLVAVPPVVGPQYCLPYQIDLAVVKQAFSFSSGDFTVTDAGGNLMFHVDGRYPSLRSKRVFVNAAGQPLLCAQRELLTLNGRWHVYRGANCDRANELFTVERSSYFQMRTSLNVFLAHNSSGNQPDFKVKGNYSERNCTILHGDQIIAEGKRKFTTSSFLLGKDKFVVTVFPGIDHAFVAALVVIMYEIQQARKQSNQAQAGNNLLQAQAGTNLPQGTI